MSTVESINPPKSSAAVLEPPTLAKPKAVVQTESTRYADYKMILKIRLSMMALITVAVGFLVGSNGFINWIQLFHTLVGVGLAAAASSALNQFMERESDKFMDRTANRPLPAGRLRAGEVFTFGMVCTFVSVFYLMAFVNPLTAGLALATIVLYVAVYTPMKRVSSLCTVVGAIAGAAPPVLGWTGAGQALDSGAFALFAILFLWQFPHFLAIAWIYKDQYAKANLKMLPLAHPRKGVTGFVAVGYALILLPVSLLPHQFLMADVGFFAVAFTLSLIYLCFSVRFMLDESRTTARQLLFCSFFYLPLILLTLTWSHISMMSL